jgi:hypothetical protein
MPESPRAMGEAIQTMIDKAAITWSADGHYAEVGWSDPRWPEKARVTFKADEGGDLRPYVMTHTGPLPPP